MKPARALLPLMLLSLAAQACVDNTAPGNDREAHLAAPGPAAEIASAGAAIDGVANALLFPLPMTDADVESLPAVGDACVFRMTSVDHPAFVYGSSGIIKLNDRLVPLPAVGEGRYAADGVSVTLRPLDDEVVAGDTFEAELVLRLPDADHELGFHGFSRCEAR